ncbi:hypothetical protein [Priestia taiwanensis]|uniref:Methyltransferase domain-containing protein n=1 Tax=Priestia taiwanensis TaxID=1347902 RepID=A0A917ATN8_9BACI|nr:hypothetical protein [Priestia taiwanensis]MBM7363856.1 hypothetical protein [Priestia taiwanensis]GGE69550.1 hypothetical protein GCM10007140_19500 [Priestia taiwanensis]
MSISTWKLIDDHIVVVDKKTGTPTELKHSVIVKDLLTYKYWDYLAWSVATLRDSEVLAVGYGAGTFTQLLTKWGIPSTGVGIEIDENYKELHSLYPSYEVKYSDFRSGLADIKSTFDTVIIDVYDEDGYVDDAYDVEWMKTYLSLRKKNGRVVFHCMDLLATLLAAEVPLPTTPTILSTMLHRIRSVTDEPVYIVPLWSSYLLWIGPPPERIETNIPHVQWLDSFLCSRMKLVDVSESKSIFSRPWTYTNIAEVNSNVLLELKQSVPELLERFNTLVEVMGPVLQKPPTDDQIYSAINSLQGSALCEARNIHALSFLYAMLGNWQDSSKGLEEKNLEFLGWLEDFSLKKM